MAQGKTIHIRVRVDEELWRQFRAASHLREEKGEVRKAVEAALRGYLEDKHGSEAAPASAE